MSDFQTPPALSRPVVAADVPADGVEGRVEASPEERSALQAQLDLPALDALVLSYELAPAGAGRFRLSGRWHARAVQTCGVTLEPIARIFDETVSTEFWTHDAWERSGDGADPLAVAPEDDGPEIIADGLIDPGQLLAELLIVALPPFPRREDAELSWRERESAQDSPFAVLKTIRTRAKT